MKGNEKIKVFVAILFLTVACQLILCYRLFLRYDSTGSLIALVIAVMWSIAGYNIYTKMSLRE